MFPEVAFIAFAGLFAASAFVAAVFQGRRSLGAGALLVSLVLVTYPYTAGLTASGRAIYWFGPIFAFVALLGVPRTRP